MFVLESNMFELFEQKLHSGAEIQTCFRVGNVICSIKTDQK